METIYEYTNINLQYLIFKLLIAFLKCTKVVIDQTILIVCIKNNKLQKKKKKYIKNNRHNYVKEIKTLK